MTTDDVVSRARAALDGVTEGPWEVDGPAYPGPDDALSVCVDGGTVAYVQPDWDDARFITWARTGVPKLVAEVERLREWQDMHRGDLASLDALIAEAEDHHDAADTEADRLRAQIAAVRAAHQRVRNRPHCGNWDCVCAQPEWVCSCGEWHRDYESMPWPCPTIRALDGEVES